MTLGSKVFRLPFRPLMAWVDWFNHWLFTLLIVSCWDAFFWCAALVPLATTQQILHLVTGGTWLRAFIQKKQIHEFCPLHFQNGCAAPAMLLCTVLSNPQFAALKTRLVEWCRWLITKCQTSGKLIMSFRCWAFDFHLIRPVLRHAENFAN